MLRENKVLTSLGLDGCELSPDGLCKVFKAVGMNTKLTSLHVSRNKFDDQSVAIGKYNGEQKITAVSLITIYMYMYCTHFTCRSVV